MSRFLFACVLLLVVCAVPVCSGHSVVESVIETAPVSVNCSYEVELGDCSASCGEGTQTVDYYILEEAQGDGLACPSNSSQSCNLVACDPIDCEYSGWVNSTCSKACGVGSITESPTITVQAQFGGQECPKDREYQCFLKPCKNAFNCLSSGPKYSPCSKTCGGGQRNVTFPVRRRERNGGRPCPADYVQECATHPCPVDCKYSEEFGECSTTCGVGEQEVLYWIEEEEAHGGRPCPTNTTRVCNQLPCSVDCVLSNDTYVATTECSSPCAVLQGTWFQRFKVLVEPVFEGEACPDNPVEQALCVGDADVCGASLEVPLEVRVNNKAFAAAEVNKLREGELTIVVQRGDNPTTPFPSPVVTVFCDASLNAEGTLRLGDQVISTFNCYFNNPLVVNLLVPKEEGEVNELTLAVPRADGQHDTFKFRVLRAAVVERCRGPHCVRDCRMTAFEPVTDCSSPCSILNGTQLVRRSIASPPANNGAACPTELERTSLCVGRNQTCGASLLAPLSIHLNGRDLSPAEVLEIAARPLEIVVRSPFEAPKVTVYCGAELAELGNYAVDQGVRTTFSCQNANPFLLDLPVPTDTEETSIVRLQVPLKNGQFNIFFFHVSRAAEN